MFLFIPTSGPSFPSEQKPKPRAVSCATGEHFTLNVLFLFLFFPFAYSLGCFPVFPQNPPPSAYPLLFAEGSNIGFTPYKSVCEPCFCTVFSAGKSRCRRRSCQKLASILRVKNFASETFSAEPFYAIWWKKQKLVGAGPAGVGLLWITWALGRISVAKIAVLFTICTQRVSAVIPTLCICSARFYQLPGGNTTPV